MYGRELETTEIATCDELASAASLIMGQADEGLPVVIVRGFDSFDKLRDPNSSIKPVLMPKEFDVFIAGERYEVVDGELQKMTSVKDLEARIAALENKVSELENAKTE